MGDIVQLEATRLGRVARRTGQTLADSSTPPFPVEFYKVPTPVILNTGQKKRPTLRVITNDK